MDKLLVNPIVITVKKGGSVRLALVKELIDAVCQTISEKKSGEKNFSIVDLTYAYGQLPLNQETSLQSNFSLVDCKLTGTYRLKTGSYGLTTIPAEFQRVMDSILAEYPQAHAFIDDILVVTKGLEKEHITTLEIILRKLDK